MPSHGQHTDAKGFMKLRKPQTYKLMYIRVFLKKKKIFYRATLSFGLFGVKKYHIQKIAHLEVLPTVEILCVKSMGFFWTVINICAFFLI